MCAEASAEPGGERQRDRHGVEKAAGKFHVIGGRGGRNGVSNADAAEPTGPRAGGGDAEPAPQAGGKGKGGRKCGKVHFQQRGNVDPLGTVSSTPGGRTVDEDVLRTRVPKGIVTPGLNGGPRGGEPIRTAISGATRSAVFLGRTLGMVPVTARAEVQGCVSGRRTSGIWN